MSVELLKNAFSSAGLTELLNPEAEERFVLLAELLKDYNSKVNITAITDTEGIYVKHFADCSAAALHLPKDIKLVDVGAGGGFPTLPIAILRPDISVLALDSTAKKLNFVATASKELGLSNVKTLAARAEEFGVGEGREKFDIAIARAVASLPVLMELCSPLVKPHGRFIAMKADTSETENSENARKLLGLSKPKIEQFDLVYGGEKQSRALMIYEKLGMTDKKYPRKYAKIKDRPL